MPLCGPKGLLEGRLVQFPALLLGVYVVGAVHLAGLASLAGAVVVRALTHTPSSHVLSQLVRGPPGLRLGVLRASSALLRRRQLGAPLLLREQQTPIPMAFGSEVQECVRERSPPIALNDEFPVVVDVTPLPAPCAAATLLPLAQLLQRRSQLLSRRPGPAGIAGSPASPSSTPPGVSPQCWPPSRPSIARYVRRAWAWLCSCKKRARPLRVEAQEFRHRVPEDGMLKVGSEADGVHCPLVVGYDVADLLDRDI